MLHKRRYKVLAPVPRSDGTGDWFMKIGDGMDNKDLSVNLYLHALPIAAAGGSVRLILRELDEEDLRQREAKRARAASRANPPLELGSPAADAGLATAAREAVKLAPPRSTPR